MADADFPPTMADADFPPIADVDSREHEKVTDGRLKGNESDDDAPLMPAKTPAPKTPAPEPAAKTPAPVPADVDDDDDDILFAKKSKSMAILEDDDDLPLSSLTPKPKVSFSTSGAKPQGKGFSRVEQMIEQKLMEHTEEPIWNAGEGAAQGLEDDDPHDEDSDVLLSVLPIAAQKQPKAQKPKYVKPKKEKIKKEKVEAPKKLPRARAPANKSGKKIWKFRELESDESSDEELSELNVKGNIEDLVRGAEDAYKRAGEGSIDDELQKKTREMLFSALAVRDDEIITEADLAPKPKAPRPPKVPKVKEPRPPREPKVRVVGDRLRKRNSDNSWKIGENEPLVPKSGRAKESGLDIVEWNGAAAEAKKKSNKNNNNDNDWWANDKKDWTDDKWENKSEDNKIGDKRERTWDEDTRDWKNDDWNSNSWNKEKSSDDTRARNKFVINFSQVKRRLRDPQAYREEQAQARALLQQEQQAQAQALSGGAPNAPPAPVNEEDKQQLAEALVSSDPFDVLFPDEEQEPTPNVTPLTRKPAPIEDAAMTPKRPTYEESLAKVEPQHGYGMQQGSNGVGGYSSFIKSKSYDYDAFVRRRSNMQFNQRQSYHMSKLMASVKSY